jgi:hypothetical protein
VRNITVNLVSVTAFLVSFVACGGVLLVLAGCAVQPPPLPVPAELLRCPGPVAVPPAPKAPRTVEAIARWGTAMDGALVKAEAARVACASRVQELHDWYVNQGRTP